MLLAILFTGLGFLAWLVSRGFRVGARPNSDFFDFYFGAKALREGADLYLVNDGGYIYPPLLALLLWPCTLLEPVTAAHTWTIVLAVLLAATAWFAANEAQRRLHLHLAPLQTAALASIATVVLGLAWKSEFQWGNSNLLVVLPVALALRWLGKRPILCGVALAFAVSIKYLPIILVPYLIFRRRWTEAAAFALVLILLLLVPALVVGWDTNLRYLSVAFRGILEMLGLMPKTDGANIHDVASGYSISITSSLARLAHQVNATPAAALAFTGLLALACLGLAYALYSRAGLRPMWRVPTPPVVPFASDALVLVEWTVLLAFSLLFSPQTQHRHLNMLMPLVAAALALALASSFRRRATILAALALATVGATAIPGVPAWRSAVEKWNQGGGAALCVLVLVFVTLEAGLAIARTRRSALA